MIGQTLNKRYKITAHLGKGAMGTVYRATDSQTSQEVALKVISGELAIEPEMLERFKREGEALRQLKHPNIVGFLDAFEYEEQYIIVMEYVSGGSLHELIKAGPLPIERAHRIALELCDALIRSHHLNIIHRDLKPENVLITEDGTPKLADFGVARLNEGTRMTRTGTQVGTPYYMAPEAWEGKPLDAQADIWSLGVMLFEMLTGQVPFGGDTGAAVMNKVLTTQVQDLKKLRANLPANLTQIIKRMLTRDKKRRYPTMREVAVDLERGQRATSLAAKTKSPRRLPALIGIGFVLTILAIWLTTQFLGAQTTEQVVASKNTPSLTDPLAAYTWYFDTSQEGWAQIDSYDIEPVKISNGLFVTKTTGDDPQFLSPRNLAIDAAKTPILEFRLRVSGGDGGSIYFITNNDTNWGESKVVEFYLEKDNQFHTFSVDMRNTATWRGTVTQLRFDPSDEPNVNIELDYIIVRAFR